MRIPSLVVAGLAAHAALLATTASSAQSVFGQGYFSTQFKELVPCNPGTNLGAVKDVDVGIYHGVALAPSGAISCWNNGAPGGNAFGQSTVPSGLGVVLDVDAGFTHNVALKSNGRVSCWGRNNFGQCLPPLLLDNVAAVAAGGDFSLALRANGEIWGWGDNQFGQRIAPVGTYTAIAAGDYHALARRSDDVVVAWGLNGNGQCNVPSDFTSPSAAINIQKVAAGAGHSAVLYQLIDAEFGGTYVSAFGWNNYGQCNAFPFPGNFVDVAAGTWHTVALRSDGTVVCRGNNDLGQSNDIPNTTAKATKVVAGFYSTVVLRVDSDCGAGPSCYQPHATPGCSDASCCALVSAADPFCTDTQWDQLCVNAAVASCGDCGVGPSCFQAHSTPGCANTTCCATVCALDPFCCDTLWDSLCAQGATANCNVGDVNGDGFVNAADLANLLGGWGNLGIGDLNGDGVTNAADLALLLSLWGS